ncbi:MAG: hypothetical protein ACFBSG_10395 [Leptolyngbyaceae cyanobacterium]
MLAISKNDFHRVTFVMVKQIHLQAGDTSIIYRRSFSSLPTTIHFEVAAADMSAPLGLIEVRGSTWILAHPPKTQPLQFTNSIKVGFWDTFFAIAVTAHTDITITLSGRPTGLSPLIGVAAIAVVAVIAVLMMLLT